MNSTLEPTAVKTVAEATSRVFNSFMRNAPAGTDAGALVGEISRTFAGLLNPQPEPAKPHPLTYLASQQRKRKYKPRAPKAAAPATNPITDERLAEIAAIPDSAIDTSDIPEAGPELFAKAEAKPKRKYTRKPKPPTLIPAPAVEPVSGDFKTASPLLTGGLIVQPTPGANPAPNSQAFGGNWKKLTD